MAEERDIVRGIERELQLARYLGREPTGRWQPDGPAALSAMRADAEAYRATLGAVASAAFGVPAGPIAKTLTPADFAGAAARLTQAAGRPVSVAQIQAVWEVECAGSGWFTDVRADILAADGPGGFLDGPDLPKILFEAHWFDRLTKGRFRAAHPNLSSARWNRALYVGGPAEYLRLDKAMRLDREAALKSASWGAPQIMGFNHDKAGFPSVESFVAAMKSGVGPHLSAFVEFVIAERLADDLARVSGDPETCREFAGGYNGTGYAANDYHGKIARALRKHAGR